VEPSACNLIRTLGSTVGYHPRVFAITFSPDGQSLAVGGQRGVLLFAVADGSVRQTLTDVSTLSLAFSPDGQILASGSDVIDQQVQCADCTIKLWQTSDGTLLRTIDSVGSTPSREDGTGLRLHACGGQRYVGGRPRRRWLSPRPHLICSKPCAAPHSTANTVHR
jgi:hypothetical protein